MLQKSSLAQAAGMPQSIELKEVRTRRELKKFIRWPDRLYKGNKYRVPQLHSFEASTLDPKKNPAFDHCEAKYWLAYDNGKIVGRIAGIINHQSNEIWQQRYMRFGWIDFVDDPNVSAALLKAVEEWALSMGITGIHGPLGFCDMDLEGMLVEGYNEVGTQAVIYNFPYYPVHLENLGYRKDVDWVQYEIIIPTKIPERIIRLSELIQEKYSLKVLRPKKAQELLPYAAGMFKVLNESFVDLYGFVQLTERQIAYYTKQYFSMIDPRYVCFVLDKKTDEVIGFGLAILSLSEALIKAKGKLFPFGFIHILRALRSNSKIDLLIQGVKPELKNKGIPAIFYSEIMQSCIDNGVTTAISSHALESNVSAFLMFKDYQTRQHLRRRCYLKTLVPL